MLKEDDTLLIALWGETHGCDRFNKHFYIMYFSTLRSVLYKVEITKYLIRLFFV